MSIEILRKLDKTFIGFINRFKDVKHWNPYFAELVIEDGLKREKYDQLFMDRSIKLTQNLESFEVTKKWLQEFFHKVTEDPRAVSFRVDFLLGLYWPRTLGAGIFNPEKILAEMGRVKRLGRLLECDINSYFYMNCFATNWMFYVQESDILISSFVLKFLWKFFRMIMSKLPGSLREQILGLFKKKVMDN
jgi:hypothetical protein